MKNYITLLTSLLMAFCLSAQGSRFSKITVASWNIGHFALGRSGDTQLSHDALDANRQAYREMLNGVGADILALVEYNPLMVNATAEQAAVEARAAILGNYHNAQIGPKHNYNCNAVFSNGFRVLSTDTVMFSKMVQTRYYLVSTMLLDGDTVKVVSTHLDWNQRENGAAYRALQIQELVEAFKNDKYVIMCGDWNVSKTSEYDPFKEAGYEMANHGHMGDIPTCPAGPSPRGAIDNIIVKGFSVGRVGTVNEAMLSDHVLIWAELVKEP